jgi:hypothetical protein
MPKKGVRVVIIGAQRRTIEVDAMTQIVIALGRELAERDTKGQPKIAAKTGADS